jgi:hypothetical protein
MILEFKRAVSDKTGTIFLGRPIGAFNDSVARSSGIRLFHRTLPVTDTSVPSGKLFGIGPGEQMA